MKSESHLNVIHILPHDFPVKDVLFMKRRASRVQGFNIESGPTESGFASPPVGGEMLAADKLSIFLSNYGIVLVLLLLLPIFVLFWKKHDKALRLLSPFISRLHLDWWMFAAL
jgi:hypothetical protein